MKMKLISKLFVSIISIIMLTTALPIISSAAIQWTPNENPVPSNKEWKVTFSLPVDEQTVTSNAVYVVDERGNKQAATPSLALGNSKEVLLSAPLNGYEEGKTYTLHVTDHIKSKNGKSLTDGVEMDFTIESINIQDMILGTWKGDYIGINFLAIFNKDYTSQVILDGEVEEGVYSISGDQMTMRLLENQRTGRIDIISTNEFTITSASKKVIRFTR
ncbi:hypothetical protein CSV78_04035 [Sporosarcina sp. P16a]|uniref:Ig-like domain-containing protein n=1 Tax=unclassified Sporosarcina TaxID=2647733 RepID=UPI000C1656CC|nr:MULTISPECIES: Ig-like domain-containing protein [unclassified Sporosarcina]PIC67970.1 hypothetical protein CSV78_04035 [Sporosarcina sp. P16a]PIC94279.1 hypothetical protein CSV70_00675 [Sporosarcina sp. P25]